MNAIIIIFVLIGILTWIHTDTVTSYLEENRGKEAWEGSAYPVHQVMNSFIGVISTIFGYSLLERANIESLFILKIIIVIFGILLSLIFLLDIAMIWACFMLDKYNKNN